MKRILSCSFLVVFFTLIGLCKSIFSNISLEIIVANIITSFIFIAFITLISYMAYRLSHVFKKGE
jgi:hypothetical protein